MSHWWCWQFFRPEFHFTRGWAHPIKFIQVSYILMAQEYPGA